MIQLINVFKMKDNIFLAVALLLCGAVFAPVTVGQIVAPITELSPSSDYNTNIRLKAGRLTSITNVQNATTLTKFKNAGLCIDVSLSDGDICATYDKDDAGLVTLFKNMQKAIQSSGVVVWGVHLPYSTAGKGAIDDSNSTNRKNAVAYQNNLIDLCVQYLNPQVIVTHPGATSVYTNQYSTSTTSGTHYYNRRRWSRESMVQMQAQLDKSNAAYGGSAILCVENCMRQTTHDALSLLDYLDYPGLEKVKVCLDTGHALIPHNSHYLDISGEKMTGTSYKTAVQEGDLITMVRLLGDKLGTLHIQQNHGLIGRIVTSGSSDTHLQPFNGGLIDWGKFYYVLLKEIGYRGCFLYEVSYISEYQGAGATISSIATNYSDVILPAYEEYLKNNNITE